MQMKWLHIVCDFALAEVSQTELMFGNKKYVLSGAAFHHRNNTHRGLYTSIVRINKPRNSKDLYLLFYIENKKIKLLVRIL